MEVTLLASLDMVVKAAPAPLGVVNTIEFQCIPNLLCVRGPTVTKCEVRWAELGHIPPCLLF